MFILAKKNLDGKGRFIFIGSRNFFISLFFIIFSPFKPRCEEIEKDEVEKRNDYKCCNALLSRHLLTQAGILSKFALNL
jgi:hypothetical protein